MSTGICYCLPFFFERRRRLLGEWIWKRILWIHNTCLWILSVNSASALCFYLHHYNQNRFCFPLHVADHKSINVLHVNHKSNNKYGEKGLVCTFKHMWTTRGLQDTFCPRVWIVEILTLVFAHGPQWYSWRHVVKYSSAFRHEWHVHRTIVLVFCTKPQHEQKIRRSSSGHNHKCQDGVPPPTGWTLGSAGGPCPYLE